MDVYRDGQKMWGVSPYKGSDESDRLRLFGVIIDRLRDMHIQRGALPTQTRAWVEIENEFGEWEWAYYECSICTAAGRSDCTCEVEINYCGKCFNRVEECTCNGETTETPQICDGCGNLLAYCTCNDKCRYCGESCCYEFCQTCPYNCETPWYYGECKDGTEEGAGEGETKEEPKDESKESETCPYNVCSMPDGECICCNRCKEVCEAQCKYGKKCHVKDGCECCDDCQGICKAKCKYNGACHVEGGCECPQKPTECICVRGTPGQGISGGLYGAARIGGRDHNGIDIGVNIGDTIKAIYSGRITKLVTEQPDRINNDYPDGYSGDRNAAGNRIRIHTNNIDGNFETSYMHLKKGNTLNLCVGKQVNAGDIIGYGGISGNSYPDSPVLHIQMNNGTNYSDHFNPIIKLPYINTKEKSCGAENCINKEK